jgi:hypothetical protein
MKFLSILTGACSHKEEKTVAMADFLDGEGNLARACFCAKCLDYAYRNVKEESLSPEILSEVKQKGYFAYNPTEGFYKLLNNLIDERMSR